MNVKDARDVMDVVEYVVAEVNEAVEDSFHNHGNLRLAGQPQEEGRAAHC